MMRETQTDPPARDAPRRLRLLASRRFLLAASVFSGGIVAAALFLLSATTVLAVGGTCDVFVTSNTQIKDCSLVDGTEITYLGALNTSIDNNASSGTGTFNSFVRIQGSPTEKGYNTDGTLQYDTKSGNWTHAILVSDIPVIRTVPGHPGEPYWELFADINEGNPDSTKPISLNKLQVYLTSDPNITGYNGTTKTFSSASTLVYDFSGDIYINDVNAGSGRADLRYRIPIDAATETLISATCSYGATGCTTYFVLYSEWGTSGATPPPTGTAISGATYDSDGGFEEWKTKVYPTLQIVKNTTGGDGTFDYTLTGPSIPLSPAPSITTASGTGHTVLYIVNAGTYTITESTLPAGWEFVNATCSLNGGTPTAYTEGANLVIGATDHLVCTFNNTKLGTIIVRKQTIGGTGSFDFTGTGGSNLPASITLSTAAQSTYVSQTFTNMAPGTYQVAETIPAGWGLTAADCGGTPAASNPASFTLAAGGTVTCSFTDTKRGTIIVQKQTLGGTGSFNFTGTGGSNLPASITLSTAAETTYVGQTFTNVVPGTYQVTETVPAGWDLTAANCGGANSAPSSPPSFTLAPGATVTCSFTDTKEGTIIVRKQTIGGTGSFVFTGTGGSNLPASITLSTAAQTTYVGQTFTNMLPGTYQVAETIPAGWDLTSADCGGTPAASNPAAFTLAPGATVTCSFTDTKEGTIIVRKQTIGGTGSFVFTGTGGSNLPASITLSTAAQTTYVGQTFTNMLPGTYQVAETIPAGWDLTSADCGGTPAASNPAAFTLAPGATVTCSFTDTKEGTIIVRKQTIGGTGSFDFTGTGGSNLPAGITLSTAAQSTYVSQTFTNVLPGTYQVAETVPAGWDLTAADCGGTPAASNPAAFTLAPGATVTCSFTDTKRGTIIVVKHTTGGNGTFTFPTTSSTDTALPLTLTITTTGNVGTFNSNTLGTPSGTPFLKPGTYTLTENLLPAWVFTDVSCSVTAAGAGGSSATPTYSATNPAVSLVLAAGATIQCDYTNSAPLTTRTQGFWATHLDLTLTVWNGGSIGGHTFPFTTDAQRTLCGSTPLTNEQLMAGFWASISHTSTGDKRDQLAQAKMQLLQQLLGAILNNYAFGSAPTSGTTIAQAKTIFCSPTSTLQQVKTAAADMAAFNQSGDNAIWNPGVPGNGKEAKDYAQAGIAYWDYLGKSY